MKLSLIHPGLIQAIIASCFISLSASVQSQESISDVFSDPTLDFTNLADRAKAVQRIRAVEQADRARAHAKAREIGIPTRREREDGRVEEIIGLDENGEFLIYTTNNLNAAISSAANLVQPSPYNLNGSGVTVGVWDESAVRVTHQEFITGSRVTVRDGATTLSSHATHVAGTVAAAGVSASARGMAPAALVDSYNWTSDTSEMTAAGATAPGQAGRIYISNHSYGFVEGWNGNEWTGSGTDQNAFDPQFGQYNSTARSWDLLTFNAPYYLAFKSAGNDNSNNPAQGSTVIIGGQSVVYDRAIHPPGDGFYRNTSTTNSASGYENIGTVGVAKNVMTVGAVNDAVVSGLRSPAAGTIASFSSRGPTDDGRIKPDIVANGVTLTSTDINSDTHYSSKSGTSMSSPSAAGSAALLVQQYSNLFNGGAMRASTLKGLIIHTATDIGNPGPDYHYGWGLMNTKEAADLIIDHAANPGKRRITEDIVTTTAQTKTYSFNWDGSSALRATLCWTDPAGASTTSHDLRTARLVNNLNLKLISPNGTEFFPFIMPFVGTWTVESMSQHATTGINNTDNVEQVLVSNPSQTGTWQAVVSYTGTLTNNQQHFSLVMSGVEEAGSSYFISSLNPAFGNTGTTVTADIIGTGLATADNIRLTRIGSSDIIATSKQLISSNTLRCQFHLTGAALGQWSLVSTNSLNQTATLSNAFEVRTTLENALDTSGITWTTSGTQPWFAQTATTSDGIDAAQSGPITHNETSSLSTTLTGPGTLTFWWRVSSEGGYDFLRFFVNGVEQTGTLARISGNVDWVQRTVTIPSGNTTVEWRYTKDGSIDSGADAAWVDQVTYTPDSVDFPVISVEQPVGTTLTNGSSTVNFGQVLVNGSVVRAFTVRNTGTATLSGLSITKSGANNADYSVGALGATSLAPGASTTFNVTFTPSATGPRNAALEIASNDPANNPFVVNLTGTGTPPGTLFITPVDAFIATGYAGGPFTPGSAQYTITNNGGSSVNWTAAKTQSWTTLSATSGTLAAGASTTVTVTINSGANSLLAGTYNDTVTFTNTTNGNGNSTRNVQLIASNINFTTLLSQNFDSSFNEASAGWSRDPSSGNTAWSLISNQSSSSHSPAVFYSAPVPASKITSYLISPVIPIPSDRTLCRISFHHNYDLESTEDGGQLQLSLDGGTTWHGVGSTTIASNFLAGPYNGVMKNNGSSNNLSDFRGQTAWTGSSGGYVQTIVELTTPAQFQGKSLRLRWAIATSSKVASTFWRVDTVSVQVASPPMAGVLALTPADDFSTAGPFGGPYSPATKQYTIQNTGDLPIIWNASSQWGWTNVSPASGSLDGGASTTVTLSFGTTAQSLPPGSHTDTINFTNATNSNGDTSREVNLFVSPPGTLAVTPAENFISTGFTGGPFTPASQQYTLQNTGSTELGWTASKTQPWIELSATSGTLAPGASTIVTVSYNSAANALGAGKHEDVVTFTNTSNGLGNTTRAVELNLTAAGTLAVTGSGGLSSSGNFGGPFNPSSIQYTLSNPGGQSIDWSAGKTANWITLSESSGTLAAGATTTLTVSIDHHVAHSLNAGSYADTITLTNNTNSNGNTTRTANLTVNPLSASISLGDLLQYHDGSAKPVSVTTTPSGLAHEVTYNGSASIPSEAGTYAVVATITDPNYIGSASGNLIIAYAVAYNGNGNTSGTAPPTQAKQRDLPLTLAANAGNLGRSGFHFIGWNTEPNGTGIDYPAGGTYSDNAAITLYAKWIEATVLIYEPFSQTAGALNGKAGGIGLSGNWTATTSASAVNVVHPPTLNYGSLAKAGGQAELASSGSTSARITTTDALANAGLLNDGATLWFSYVFMKTANGGSNEHSGFAFGTEGVSPGSSGLNMLNSGYGLGVYTNNSSVVASSWTGGARTGGTAASLQGLSTPTLVIGKIVWGANASADETITIYTRPLDHIGSEPTTGGGVRTVAAFNQAALNTISFGQRNSGGIHTYDEIRFGASFGDVVPSAATLASFSISGIPAQATVNTPITGITITAMGNNGQTFTGFNGTVVFSGTAGITGTSANFVNGVLSNLSLTPANVGNGLTFEVNNGQGPSGSITLNVISLFDSWLSGGSGSDTGSGSGGGEPGQQSPGADPDGNGLSNLQEFAFGLEPGQPSVRPITFTPGQETVEPGTPALVNFASDINQPEFRAVFTRRKDHEAAGLVYSVQFSADLVQWTTSQTIPTVVSGNATQNPGPVEAVSVPFPASVALSGGGTKKPNFFRVTVAMP